VGEEKFKEKFTSLVHKCIDFLFIKNPRNTSMGVLFGIIFRKILNIFQLYFNDITYIDLSSIYGAEGFIVCIIFGVFIFNFPALFSKVEKLDPRIEAVIIEVERAKDEGNLTPQEAKALYERLILKVIEDLPTLKLAQGSLGTEKEHS